jgi:BirA family biotin operon repressor/biotin-[acetyl-CoA-carboxylase] ligase
MGKSHFDVDKLSTGSKLGVTQGNDPFEKTRAALAGTIFGDVRYTSRTQSTNDDALRLLEDSENSGVTIVTGFQTRGRGRRGRHWIASPGSALLFTTILPVTLDSSTLWSVPFWCGLAIKDALAVHGIQTTLQWPNDILLGDRKVAGILCVSRGIGTRAWAACGVGINLVRTNDVPYAEIKPPPAFVGDVTPIEPAELLTTILRSFAASLTELENADHVARRWEAAAGLRGTRYRLLVDGEPEAFEALAQRLGKLGALVVIHNGSEREIALADAKVVR